jgi:streptogramin lyase
MRTRLDISSPCALSRSPWKVLAILLLFAVGCLLSSCGSALSKSGFPTAPMLTGMVHGGQQGVSGATIKLYAAGATGYGSTATSLLTKTVTTNGAGGFTITGDYTCPTPSTQVYIVSSGGNPGLSLGTNNAALILMAALGPCGNLSASTFIYIDEVTTVASVYALAPFMSVGAGTKLGTSSTNAQGLANAFATVKSLVNTAKGTAPGPSLPAGATAPTAELNTLADILALCVNSTGLTSECLSLFTAATPNGGSAPTNTIDATLDIAQNPVRNVASLFSLVTATGPFQPVLLIAPNDWTMDIKYTGGGLNAPKSIAVDASGNVWLANGGNNSISKFSGSGAISGSSGYTGGGLNAPWGIAVDPSGNVWTSDPIAQGSGAVSKFSSTGSAISGSSGYTGGGLSDPYGIAINGTGIVWTANVSTTSAFQNNGSAQSGSPHGPGGTHNYYNIAVDGSGNIWASDNLATGDVEKFSSTGTVIGSYSAGSQKSSWGIAVDSGAHIWISNSTGNSVTELNNSGTSVGNFTGGGLSTPQGLAVDGLGNVWIANNGGNSVTELSSGGASRSSTTGFKGGGMSSPFSLAIDGSGNVWVSNNATGSNSVTEIVGAAAPVVTPLSLAAKNNTLGARP